MKKKVLLSSILVIAICLCLIVGSTFALFTSEYVIDVAVKSGNLDFKATLDSTTLKVWSRLEMIDDSTDNVFANGGTATVKSDGSLEIVAMTPGDNVQVQIDLDNTETDIAIKYKVVMSSDNGELLSALVGKVLIGGVEYDMKGSETSWIDLALNAPDPDPLTVTITLPDTVGNNMMQKGANLKITVHAIQADGVNP